MVPANDYCKQLRSVLWLLYDYESNYMIFAQTCATYTYKGSVYITQYIHEYPQHVIFMSRWLFCSSLAHETHDLPDTLFTSITRSWDYYQVIFLSSVHFYYGWSMYFGLVDEFQNWNSWSMNFGLVVLTSKPVITVPARRKSLL